MVYNCDGCGKGGNIWSFYCEECDFDLHPKCALKEGEETKDDEKDESKPGEGWACDGEMPISELVGKTVGLYFSLSSCKSCDDFTPKLAEFYEKLKAQGENFEDKCCEKLVQSFELSTVPTWVVIRPDGKTLPSNVAKAIEEHGIQAHPFTAEKFAELAEIEKATEAAQTLESVLVSGDRNFVIAKDGAKILVSDLVGKNILLYFSAYWCPPCRAFLPTLIKACQEIKAKDDAFEVIFISLTETKPLLMNTLQRCHGWQFPFGDERNASLSRKFKVQGISMLVAFGPTGQTITKEARMLVMLHGANAYTFIDEHLKEMEAK
ncbi:hypothetical protein GH714_023423 [Hevea brasiliensis]|uniref:protein-disulfide reductase n=1 Tax=Hevea brasiliensis TaxID=3981 RepID=A0A6A6KGK9_HEVBR|nr:hypothetical protein GH714_023423 [Hevea brasiliensis]